MSRKDGHRGIAGPGAMVHKLERLEGELVVRGTLQVLKSRCGTIRENILISASRCRSFKPAADPVDSLLALTWPGQCGLTTGTHRNRTDDGTMMRPSIMHRGFARTFTAAGECALHNRQP